MKSINVKGKKYSIIKVDKFENESQLGECSSDYATIKINGNMKGLQEQLVLLHEIFHAYLEESTLHNLVSDELNEALCDLFAEATVNYIKTFNQAEKRAKRKPK